MPTCTGAVCTVCGCQGGPSEAYNTASPAPVPPWSEVRHGVQSALRTIVFCNKIETCRKVENVLKRISPHGEQGNLVLPYHAAIEEGQRVKNLKVDPLPLPSLDTC